MDQKKLDQADLLRKQMDEINQNQSEDFKPKMNFDPDTDEIDILNLPPRSVVHEDSKTKFKWKLNLGFVRFVLVLILIFAILALTYEQWSDYFLVETFNKI